MKVRNDFGASRERVRRSREAALGDCIRSRLSRRSFLSAIVAGAAAAALVRPGFAAGAGSPEISLSRTAGEVMPEGYQSQVVVAAGDPIMPGAPPYLPYGHDPQAAAMQFGVNCDYTALLPVTPQGPAEDDHALLFVNHEYPSPELMWPGLDEARAGQQMSLAQVATTMAAVGASVCEVRRRQGRWQVEHALGLNRRLTATTPMRLSGPAAGAPALRTRADPTGRMVRGTLSNCNGGMTPWGTVLSCEEGAGWIFAGDFANLPEAEALKRYYYDETDNDRYGWSRVEPRFRLEHEPNEPNRYEWVVEIDPYDPSSTPVKRTALGRFAHEGAHTALAADGRVVVYMGDDWEFEYCYRFVTAKAFDANNRRANRDLLDDGVLSVARFHSDGRLEWLPLVLGYGPLTAANGFDSQADVVIHARRAADLLGATPMDAAEGYQPNPANGRVYLALTSNADRSSPNPANPRAHNRFGHLLELSPPPTAQGPDHAADEFTWEVLALCGDPSVEDHRAAFHPGTTSTGWFTDPDNLGFDAAGRMWVCTDGVQPSGHDALYVMPVDGPNRARPQLFYCPPAGAECCSPAFSDDGRTLFLGIQHPGEGVARLEEVETHWPATDGAAPPRAAVVAITEVSGHRIGSAFGF